MGLVQRDALAQVAVGVVDRALGQPGRQVEQLDGERLGVRPLLARAARAGQGHALHGRAPSAGTRGRPARGRRGWMSGNSSAACGSSRRSSRKSATTPACSSPSRACRRSVSMTWPGCRSGAPPTSRTAAQQHDPGVRQPGDVEGQQPGEHVQHQPAPGRRGQRALPSPRAVGLVLVREVVGPRLGHDAVRVEDAGLGAQQVDVPGERRELRKAGQLRQRPGRVEHRPAGARAQRLVDDQPGQERLARAQAADDRRRGPDARRTSWASHGSHATGRRVAVQVSPSMIRAGRPRWRWRRARRPPPTSPSRGGGRPSTPAARRG